jgi:glycerol-3-phosphate O-acyltransferase
MARSRLLDRVVRRGGLTDGLWRRAGDRLFRHLEVETAWREAAESAVRRGPVVYVLKSASTLDYLALDHLTRKLALPPIGFVNELPIARGADLGRVIQSGDSAALFLSAPPAPGATGRRPRRDDGLFDALIALQRRLDEPIIMLPTLFVWTRSPEKRGFSLVDTLFGPVDSPTELRRAGQFLVNYKRCELRAGEPLSLREIVEEEAGGDLSRRLSYSLLRKIERERRTLVGPAQKPPDRLREEVVRSPKLRSVIEELAGPRAEDRARLVAKARQMLREMQTIPDPQTQASVALLAERVLDRVYGGLDVDEEGIERLRRLRSEGSVVLLPSHKSHVDYIVLSYVLRERSIPVPLIAAGDNLSFFPAGPILRRCGAFYIRRSFRGDKLYTAVLDAYVRRLMRDGHMLEFFLEGTRSRTGKPLPPMLGLLNMVVSSALGLASRRLFFVPVSIGYERSVEESSFARELSGGEKQQEDAGQLLRAGGVLADRWGRINIQLGDAIELADLERLQGIAPGDRISPAKRRAMVKRLGHQVMSEINRVTAVTPGALVSLVLLSGRKGISYDDLVGHCERVLALMLRLGARATPSIAEHGQLRELGVRETLRLYLKGGLVEQHVPGDTLTAEQKRRRVVYTGPDVIFTVPDTKRLRLDFTKNHIVHWIVDRGLVAVAFRPDERAAGVLERDVRDRVQSLSRLFKYEFMFRADAPFGSIFDDLVADMVSAGELRRDGPRLFAGQGRNGLDGGGWLQLHANAVRNFLESYAIAARGLAPLLKGPMERKELVTKSLRLGERMFLEGDIERSEAVSRPMLENAVASFVEQGYLVRRDGKLALADSFASAEALATIEGRIAAFVG